MATDLGFDRPYSLIEVDTPAGIEYRLMSPWDTVVKTWDAEPLVANVRRRALLWSSANPESSRPVVVVPPKRSALDRVRNRLASALWVR